MHSPNLKTDRAEIRHAGRCYDVSILRERILINSIPKLWRDTERKGHRTFTKLEGSQMRCGPFLTSLSIDNHILFDSI